MSAPTDCPPLLLLRVIVLEDNDVLHLTGGGYGIYNTGGSDVEEAVPRVLLTLQMEVERIMKVGGRTEGGAGKRLGIPSFHAIPALLPHFQGGYKHYMQNVTISHPPPPFIFRVATSTTCRRRSTSSPSLCCRP